MALDLQPTKADKTSYDRVTQVKHFLEKHYEVKVNVFDTSKTIIEAKSDVAKKMHDKFSPTRREISLHMEMENLRGCKSILNDLLESPNHIVTFNPITDYLNALDGKWKGDSQFEKLCSCITMRDFGDKPEGYYQNRFRRILRKWLVACIANSLGTKSNEVMFGLIHPDEGIGKTGFIKFLVPKSLTAYYRQSGKTDKNFNLQEAFAKFFLINFDEFHGITKNNAEDVKQTLSDDRYILSLRDTNAVPRMGNGAFTSNKSKEMGGFLHPNMGHRRWGACEADTINWKKMKETVDVDQLWAEMYVLYKDADFDYVWNKEEDFNEFKEYNRRYLIETHAYRLIHENYRMPTDEDAEETIEFKMPMEMLQELRSARKINSSMSDVSEVTIGLALKALGFERKGKKIDKINSRYGYNVVKLF